jgi:hypothetical protein
MWVDVWESRLARFTLTIALIAYALTATLYAGLIPLPDRGRSTLPFAVLMVGHVWMLASLASYARYVVLDVQGLIPTRKGSEPRDDQRRSLQAPSNDSMPVAQQRSDRETSTHKAGKSPEWVDGRRPEESRYVDDSGDDRRSKTNKHERGRLRKLKAERRAA